MQLSSLFYDLMRRTSDPVVKARIRACMSQALRTSTKLFEMAHREDARKRDDLCRRCRGRKYIGADGHTCEACDGSGYTIED